MTYVPEVAVKILNYELLEYLEYVQIPPNPKILEWLILIVQNGRKTHMNDKQPNKPNT